MIIFFFFFFFFFFEKNNDYLIVVCVGTHFLGTLDQWAQYNEFIESGPKSWA